MAKFEVDYEYKTQMYGSSRFDANNEEDAKELALEYATDFEEGVSDIKIVEVREVL